MTMVSPFRLFESDLNYFKIATNQEIGAELREFFCEPKNEYLWKLNTQRQDTTKELKHTEAIHLRYIKNLPTHFNTLQSNQLMDVGTSSAMSIPIFYKSFKWFQTALENTGAKNIEFGRIFVSRLAPLSKIDLHIDEGKYFSYYDRFHFTITAAAENSFFIKDEDCIMAEDSLFWVDNHVPHWLENKSTQARINFILDVRLS
jgi:hypothetical protein